MHRKIEQNNISYSKTIQILHTKQLKGDIMLFLCFVNFSVYMYMDVTKHIKTQHIIMWACTVYFVNYEFFLIFQIHWMVYVHFWFDDIF